MTPECPKCHQYKVSTTTELIDQATEKPVSSEEEIGWEAVTPAVWTLLGIAVLIPVVRLCVVLSFGPWNQMTPSDYILFIIEGVFLLAGAILAIRNKRLLAQRRREALLRARREIYYFCNNCHYEW